MARSIGSAVRKRLETPEPVQEEAGVSSGEIPPVLDKWKATLEEWGKDPNKNTVLLAQGVASWLKMLKEEGSLNQAQGPGPAGAEGQGSPAGAASSPAGSPPSPSSAPQPMPRAA